MSEPIYRQFDKGRYQQHGDDGYYHENGRHYRITEMVPRMDGGANFQAVEVEYQTLDELKDEIAKLQGDDPCLPRTEAEAAPSSAPNPTPEWKPPEFAPIVPPLKMWAKDKGLWTGRGPVSSKARAAYTEEFGVEG